MYTCWTLIDFDDTKTLMLCLLIKLNKCFRMQIKIPKKIFTNEHLELFSSIQIRISNKVIRIPQVTLQFWSFSSKFEEGNSNPSNSDSNPSNNDSNPHSRKFRLTKAIRISHEEIRIQIPVRKLRLTNSNP